VISARPAKRSGCSPWSLRGSRMGSRPDPQHGKKPGTPGDPKLTGFERGLSRWESGISPWERCRVGAHTDGLLGPRDTMAERAACQHRPMQNSASRGQCGTALAWDRVPHYANSRRANSFPRKGRRVLGHGECVWCSPELGGGKPQGSAGGCRSAATARLERRAAPQKAHAHQTIAEN